MSQSTIQPYLFFGGCCEEALNFYQQALDAKIEMLMRFNESPDPPPPGALPEGFEDKIMHASFRVGNSVVLASDGCGQELKAQGVALSLNVTSKEEANRYFVALCDGGEITMPLGETFWSSCFGIVADKFGVRWMVGVFDPAAETSDL